MPQPGRSRGSLPAAVTITGPGGSGLAGEASDPEADYNRQAQNAGYCSILVESPKIPPEGDYTVGYKSDTLTFRVPDQSSAENNIPVVAPAVLLNADNSVQKIGWIVQRPGGSAVDAPAVIQSVKILIDGEGTPCSSTYGNPDRIYESGTISSGASEHTLSCQSLRWGNMEHIYFRIIDVYGNQHEISYTNYN